jgi:hypothetical protein
VCVRVCCVTRAVNARNKPTVVRGRFFFVLYSRDDVYVLRTFILYVM